MVRHRCPNRSRLLDLSAKRSKLSADLARALITLGEPVISSGSLKGALHRTWMELREALGRSADLGVLAECARGERFLLERYAAILREAELPPGVQRLLRDQQLEVERNLTAVEGLEPMDHH